MGIAKSKRSQHTLPEDQWWCIWCDERPPAVTFRTREHIIAESLGGHRNYRLHRGVVCDACNRGVLQAIDEEMLLIGPVRFVRSYFGLGPRFTHVTSGVVFDRDADQFTIDGGNLRRGTSVTFTGYADRTGVLTTTFGGQSEKVRGEHFSRGLHRIAYNALAHHCGADHVRTEFRFLRDLVLDLERIRTRAFLLDEQSLLKAMQGPKSQWESQYEVLRTREGPPETVLIRIGPWPCFVSVAQTTFPLRGLLGAYPWLKASTVLDVA